MDDDEAMLVATVREFVDKEVRPTVREVEHANEYPEAWIEQMKRIGIFGLAVPEEYGGSPVSMPCYVLVTQELARGWMSLAGAMGGGREAPDAVRHRRAEAALPAGAGHR
jgi:alkylation response protein AidB-like acyl-CoA dehydrogenase